MAESELARLVGANIRRIREERGLTQARLGELIGRQGSEIGAWERADRSLGLDTVSQIARELEVDWRELFGESTEARRLLAAASGEPVLVDVAARARPKPKAEPS